MKVALARDRPVSARAARTPDAVTAQEQLLPFLLNPQSYPHRVRAVRLIQTHASFVFIAAPFVYKVKKPVNLGFLNFSTLEKRRHYCEREVALNRRLSSNIYLGVVPISRHHGRFTFGKGGEVVEYAVKMRKLSARHFLDQLVARHEVTPRDLRRIAHFLKQFYQAQKPTAEIASWGRIDRLQISTDENFRQTRKFLGDPGSVQPPRIVSGTRLAVARRRKTERGRPLSDERLNATISRPAFKAIRLYTDYFYARHRRLFAARVTEQRIRDCHGDLHLEHIHLTPRALQIYDCIEFNDRLRYLDVANDAAFLAMDLDYEGRPDLARSFATQMAAALQDDGMRRLMDFYKCYRAYVRGKVESLHSVAHAASEEERRASAERARRYFRLALQYAIAGSQPMVLAVMGPVASGKSTLARALNAELGWPVYSSDYLRKSTAGLPLYQRSSPSARRHLYSRAVTEQTYDRLLSHAEAQLQKGHSVILDATFGDREYRRLLVKRLGKHGFAWRALEAQASDATVKRRLRAREASAGELSDARLEEFPKLTHLYQPPVELPSSRRVKLSTSGPLDQTISQALQSVAGLHVDAPCPSP